MYSVQLALEHKRSKDKQKDDGSVYKNLGIAGYKYEIGNLTVTVYDWTGAGGVVEISLEQTEGGGYYYYYARAWQAPIHNLSRAILTTVLTAYPAKKGKVPGLCCPAQQATPGMEKGMGWDGRGWRGEGGWKGDNIGWWLDEVEIQSCG